MKKRPEFIFFDPTGMRQAWVKNIALLLLVAVVIVYGLFFTAVLINPNLPNRAVGLISSAKEMAETAEIVKPSIPSSSNTQSKKIFAFYVNWDPDSYLSLQQNIDKITFLVPEWLHINTDGSLTQEIDPKIITLAKKNKVAVLPLLNNYQDGGWQTSVVSQILRAPEKRQALVDNLFELVKGNGLEGINIDLEALDKGDREYLSLFMKELYARFHKAGLLVTQDIEVANPAFDQTKLAKYNDFVIAMLYQEHGPGDEPGPIASEKWFKDTLDNLQIPEQKLIIGLGGYGIDWPENSVGEEIRFKKVIDLANGQKGDIRWDKDLVSASFTYTDSKGTRHEVWFQDAVSMYNQILTSGRYVYEGFAFWRFGSEDPSAWRIFENLPRLPEPDLLTNLNYKNFVRTTGAGEFFTVIQKPSPGYRRITRRTDGLLDEKYLTFPSHYIVQMKGYHPKKVAITFDDGPDRVYTLKILRILKAYNIKATFFVTGLQASRNPDVLNQIYQQGHLIGNHTFHHINIAKNSPLVNKLEFNSTQRLIESVTGHQTVLFRPPYITDHEPLTVDEVINIMQGQEFGYMGVGNYVDPQDWQRPDNSIIVKRIIAGVNKGNVILLHDSGGKRDQTIKALPQIIKELRARGYTFVGLDELLGVSREKLMPPADPIERGLVSTNGLVYSSVSFFRSMLWTLAFVTTVLGFSRLIFLVSCSFYQYFCYGKKRVVLTAQEPAGCMPFVSVIIAAYNEEKVIKETLKSIVRSSHTNLEIIVVDDGSTDQTAAIVREMENGDGRIKLIRKPNGGKASAINTGLKHSKAELIVAVDADTVFRPDTISILIEPFKDPKVGAVSGNVRVGNISNLLTLMQHLEYITGFNLERRAFDLLNCITVIPGAAGAWRKNVIIEAGGYSSQTLAEDTDLTLSVSRLGYHTVFRSKALAYTEVPATIRSFLRQRIRWSYGTIQCIWKHRKVLFNPNFGTLGFIAMPNILLFQLGFQLIAPLIDLISIICIIKGKFLFFALYFGIYYFVDLLVCWYSFLLEGEKKGPLKWVFVQRILYRFIFCFVVLKSVCLAVKGVRLGWRKFQRQGTNSKM